MFTSHVSVSSDLPELIVMLTCICNCPCRVIHWCCIIFSRSFHYQAAISVMRVVNILVFWIFLSAKRRIFWVISSIWLWTEVTIVSQRKRIFTLPPGKYEQITAGEAVASVAVAENSFVSLVSRKQLLLWSSTLSNDFWGYGNSRCSVGFPRRWWKLSFSCLLAWSPEFLNAPLKV